MNQSTQKVEAIEKEISVTTQESNNEEIRKFLLSDESFTLLRSAQEKIKQETEVVPSMRKLINVLVNPESVKNLTQRFIEKLK